jgi:Type II secretion system (T2SS), protein K
MGLAIRKPGIALLLALAVVIVLSAFLSELLLDTGLEVRAVQNLRDSAQAQSLARSAFKAIESSLKSQSQQDFITGYRQINAIMKLSPIPFEGGLLTRLQVESLDGLFNVNALGSQRSDSSEDRIRLALFRNLIAAIPIPLEQSGEKQQITQYAPALTDAQVAGLYAALVDWIDTDDTPYVAPGAVGAEQPSYVAVQPEYQVKNALLDRLEEVRLVQGWVDSHIPWPEFEKRFVALKPSQAVGGSYLPEKLDINLASREQIARWLVEHRIDDTTSLGNYASAQQNLNALADKPDAVAAALVPDGFEPTYWTDMGKVTQALQSAGVTAANPGSFLSMCSQYLNVRIVVDVNGTTATLAEKLLVARDSACGKAQSVNILQQSLN